MSNIEKPTPAYWRIGYYLAWMAPTLIASFANYTVALESNAEASFQRYFAIHLFYWLAWGLIGEIAYCVSPDRLKIDDGALFSFITNHIIVLTFITIYFSAYFVFINPSQFANVNNLIGYFSVLFTKSGSILFHVMNVVTYLFVLGAALLLKQSHYARAQEIKRISLESKARRLEASLSEAKLSVLNNQIHPHFLFNSMNNIAALIESKENDRAYEAVALLGKLLRKTFEYLKRQSISVREELDLISALMRMGEIRFGDRLTWTCHCDDALYTELVPPFIIQPLVENALRHAVEATREPVHIEIEVKVVGRKLCMRVADNGVGDTNNQAINHGVGLQNLRERLKIMGGDGPIFGFNDPTKTGFAVTFYLPKAEADV